MVFPAASAGNSAQRVLRSLINFSLILQVFFPVEKRAVDFHSVIIHALESLGCWEDATQPPSDTDQHLYSHLYPLLCLKPRWILMESLNGLLSPCPGMETFMEVSTEIFRKFLDPTA